MWFAPVSRRRDSEQDSAGNGRYTASFSTYQPMPADDPPSFLPVAVPAPRAGRSPITRIRRLFARAPLPVDTNNPRPPAAGLYVDGENLPGGVPARRLIARILDDWPSDRPPVRTLSVYVPADKTALWEAWCTDRLPGASSACAACSVSGARPPRTPPT